VVGALSLGLLFVRRKELPIPETETGLLSRESALGAGTIVILVIALVILFGTTLPIFSTVHVEPSFYDRANFPIVVVMALLIGFSLCIQWGMDETKEILKRSWKALLVSAVVIAVLGIVGIRDAGTLAFVFSLVFALVVNLEIGLKLARGDPRFLGGKIAHIGVAVFLLGVIASGRYNEKEHIALPLNSPKRVFGDTLTYVGHRPTADGKFAFDVKVSQGNESFELSLVMFEAGEQGLMRNPDIASFFTRDFYLSPVSLDEGGGSDGATQETYTLRTGEAIAMRDVKATFVKFEMDAHGKGAMMGGGGGMSVGSIVTLTKGAERETIVPVTVFTPNVPPEYKPVASKLLDANIQLLSMNVGMEAGQSTITLGIQRSQTVSPPLETLIVEASVKPFIGLVWVGTVLLMIGFLFSIVKRTKDA